MKSIKYILLAAGLLVLTFILPINVRAAEQYYTITFLDYEAFMRLMIFRYCNSK